jgi:hypothetical protein
MKFAIIGAGFSGAIIRVREFPKKRKLESVERK